MPTISDFFGIRVCMYYTDTVQHKKPHVHVFYGEYEAAIGLDCDMLAGSIPNKQYRMVAGWITLHEDDLYAAWIDAVKGISPRKIQPLR